MKYLVIGKENCSRCDMVKNILSNKGIEYEYKLLESFDDEEKSRYINMARKVNKLEMPLIIKNDIIYDIKEVI